MSKPKSLVQPGDRVRIVDGKTGDVFEVDVQHFESDFFSIRLITASGREFAGSGLSIEILSRPAMPWGAGYAVIGVARDSIYAEADPDDDESMRWALDVMAHIQSPSLYTPGLQLGSWVTKCDLPGKIDIEFELHSTAFLAWRVWTAPRDAMLQLIEDSSEEVLSPYLGEAGGWTSNWKASETSLYLPEMPWHAQRTRVQNMLRGSSEEFGGFYNQDWDELESRLARRVQPLCTHD